MSDRAPSPRRLWRAALTALASLVAALMVSPALAQKAPFDLAGPSLDVRIIRGDRSLPIAQAPALAAGDALHIEAAFPPGETAHYLLVVAFLRGATNPPPKSWFFGFKTWEQDHGRRGKNGALEVHVPAGAEQALIFLAPQTNGDFDTLRDAVRAKPGAFVRASQDLNQLDRNRSRLNLYLATIRRTERDDPARLKDVSTELARTLGIRVDASCFDRAPDLQAPCLMQDQDSLVLATGDSHGLVSGLASGAGADLMTQLGYAPQMGAGAYSPYVGAVLDIARMLDSLGVAHYQYIPALAEADGDQMNLRLNTAPSFGSVKSVLVAALPPVGEANPPVLRPADADAAFCLEAPQVVLRVDGAPLVFSTAYASGLHLILKTKGGEAFNLPVRPDAAQGGLTADASILNPADFPSEGEATLEGLWGQAPFSGPAFRFQNAADDAWQVDEADRAALVSGHDAVLRLTGGKSSCVRSVSLQAPGEPPTPIAFHPVGPDAIAITAPLKALPPGDVTFAISSWGETRPRDVDATVAAQAVRVDRLILHAGDHEATLEGAGLGAVRDVMLGGAKLTPAADQRSDPDGDDAQSRLNLTFTSDRLAALPAGRRLTASVALSDGRSLELAVTLLAPRPRIRLLARSLKPPAPTPGVLTLTPGAEADIPRGGTLSFSLAAADGGNLSPDAKAEVATADGAFVATLEPGAGLTRADAHVAVASLDTGKAFSASAFGPLRVRLVGPHGASDWLDLGVLVRLPEVTAVRCAAAATTCQLTGANLFLIAAVASDPGFTTAVTVPDGFPGDSLAIPAPHDGRLYLKLRDDPETPVKLEVGWHRRTPHHAPAPSPEPLPQPPQQPLQQPALTPQPPPAAAPSTAGSPATPDMDSAHPKPSKHDASW